MAETYRFGGPPAFPVLASADDHRHSTDRSRTVPTPAHKDRPRKFYSRLTFRPLRVTQGGLLKSPFDIAVDPNGNILIVDLVADKLIRIDRATHAQTVLTQGGLLAGVRSVEVFGGG
jgi:hypothetical protein